MSRPLRIGRQIDRPLRSQLDHRLETIFGDGTGFGGIGARIIVVCLFAIFGSHAHQMIKKQRSAQQDIEELKAANQKMAQEIAELKQK